MKIKRTLLIGLVLTLILGSCASTRKCDGRKGVRTSMGTL